MWFYFVLRVLMVVMDVAMWVVTMRLTNKRLWRVLASIFLAGQTVAVLLIIGGLDWPQHAPKAVFAAVLIWHFFGLGVLAPLATIRCGVGMVRGLARVTGIQRKRPVAPPASANTLRRREFIGACAALAPPLFTVGLTGIALAQLNHFRVRRFTLSIPALPRALDGITIAHLSDIHVGRITCGRVLREIVNATNALRADLVVLTGDLINYELTDLSEAIALVKAMEGRYGLWMVEGNHDLGEDGGEFEQRVKTAGVPLLLNESAVANVRGYPVQFLGLGWIDSDVRPRDEMTALCLRQLMKQRQPDAFPLLLAHHPHAFDAAIKAGLPLTLAGHTHGGQLMLDSQHGVGSVSFRYWSGLYQRGRSQLIVSNGIGNWFPLRINAPAEIVHLTLRSAAA
jgi:predicted MPP superfamily phosphohydrolase